MAPPDTLCAAVNDIVALMSASPEKKATCSRAETPLPGTCTDDDTELRLVSPWVRESKTSDIVVFEGTPLVDTACVVVVGGRDVVVMGSVLGTVVVGVVVPGFLATKAMTIIITTTSPMIITRRFAEKSPLKKELPLLEERVEERDGFLRCDGGGNGGVKAAVVGSEGAPSQGVGPGPGGTLGGCSILPGIGMGLGPGMWLGTNWLSSARSGVPPGALLV